MEPGLRPHVLHRQRQALFIAENGLVLRAVVRKHTRDVRHARHAPQVQQEDDDAQQTLHEVTHHGAVDEAVRQSGEQRRQQDEQHHGQRDAEHHGHADDDVLGLLLAEVLFDPLIELVRLALFLQRQQVCGVGERLHALDHGIDERHHAADQRPAQNGVLVLDHMQLVDLFDEPVRRAADDGLLLRAAHQNALHQRLSADGRAEADVRIGRLLLLFAHSLTSELWDLVFCPSGA